MSFISAFIFGLTAPLRAIALMFRNRAVFLWALLPILLSVVVYCVLWGTVLAPARDWVSMQFQNWMVGVLGQENLAGLQRFVRWVVTEVVQILFFVTMIFTFAWIANLVALPVNDFVAQATERALNPPLTRPPSKGWVHEVGLVWIDFKKSILSLIGLLLCLSVAWVPIMNVFALVITWLLLTYQYVSYPQTRRAIGARGAVVEIFKNFWLSLGFGISISIGLTIPIVAILVPTLAVIGGTILFSAMQQPEEKSQLTP